LSILLFKKIPYHWIKLTLDEVSTPADLINVLPTSLNKIFNDSTSFSFYSMKSGAKRKNTTYVPFTGFDTWYLFKLEEKVIYDNWEERGDEVYLSIMQPLMFTQAAKVFDYPFDLSGKTLLLKE